MKMPSNVRRVVHGWMYIGGIFTPASAEPMVRAASDTDTIQAYCQINADAWELNGLSLP